MKNKEETGDRFCIVVISIVLAAALAVTAVLICLSTQKGETGIQTGQAASDAGGGAVVSGGTENGMKLEGEKIPSAE